MDIREINRIKAQFNAGEWPQFLKSVKITNLRGIHDSTISFNYPISVLVGENGTGKSTILKSIACAYLSNDEAKSYYPSIFFVDTPWERIKNVTLEYVYRRGAQESSQKLTKHEANWSYPENRPKRNVYFFDIARTLPLDATIGYSRIAKKSAREIATSDLNEEYVQRLSQILGRRYSKARFANTNVDEKKMVGLLTREFGEFSQFHQGAGEDATLDLMRTLQEVPNYSLIIIDEVEASLHPRAQRKLIQFLLTLSREKRIQVILSTHSPYILEELPEESRILLLQNHDGFNVVYGVSTEFAMSKIDESNHPELYVYVEDVSAQALVRELILKTEPTLLQRIEIIPSGTASVLKTLGQLSNSQKLPFKSVIVLDGDMEDSVGCIKLPGDEAPERVIFNELKDKNWPNLVQRLGIGAGDLFAYLEEAMLEEDHHKWCSMIGDRILKSRTAIWETLVEQWVACCCNPTVRTDFVNVIEERLS